jgi:amidase
MDTIGSLGNALRDGSLSSVEAVTYYTNRIDTLDQRSSNGLTLNSIIEHNPEALAVAKRLDREAKAGRWRGPLHGVPIVVKDNIDTGDRMHTTAGSLAMAKVRAPRDSFVVEQLRLAGAIIIAKSNLSEWANLRGRRSVSGWSSLGGQTRNPHDLTRSPSGSSSGSGVAVAADLCVAAIGTETDGSITSPASANGIVGFKPTVGLVSRTGIIPISHSQDTAGPMAKTVEDAALLLAAMRGVDRRDRATQAQPKNDLSAYELSPLALKGARVGVAPSMIGTHPKTRELFDAALDTMRACGAVVIEDVNLGKIADLQSSEATVLWYELKAGLNAYLRTAGHLAPADLASLIEYNNTHADRVLTHFGQEHFIRAQSCASLRSSTYREALERTHRLGRMAVERAIRKNRLDVLVAPTGEPAWLIDTLVGDASNDDTLTTMVAAVPGFPHLSVPMGYVGHLPVGISFIAGAWKDAAVLNMGFAYEQATQHLRKPPLFKR